MEVNTVSSLSNIKSKPLLSIEILEKEYSGNYVQEIQTATSTLETMTKIISTNPIDWKNKLNGVNIQRLYFAAKSFTLGRKSTRGSLKKIVRLQRKRKNSEAVAFEEIHDGTDSKCTDDRISSKNPTRVCYICKIKLSLHHQFYSSMCPECGDFNFYKRSQLSSLYGQVALVTGGRIKIGYQVVLKLLRSGAFVIVTTRFPHDATKRYSAEHDFSDWKNRLHVYALDMRFLSNVEAFCSHIVKTYNRLDIVIQNAAQTIRRPVPYYQNLYENECASTNKLSLVKNWENSNTLALSTTSLLDESKPNSSNTIENIKNQDLCYIPSSVKSCQMILLDEDKAFDSHNCFPVDKFDKDGQQLDLRSINSWLLKADEVATAELVEVTLINSLSPFIILTKLSPILKKTASERNGTKRSYVHVIMVSAMEGKFNRNKTSSHPHTNCAKASLNMLVRTSASYYHKFGILLNSVDTGWVTDELPLPLQTERKYEFKPPLDDVDGAARILDPICHVINHGSIESGKFYKDYKHSTW